MTWTELASNLVPIAATAAVTLAGSWLALRGTRTTDRTSSLDKAAGWWEKRGDQLEEDVRVLKETQKAQGEELARQRETTRLYRRVIGEVIQWLTELLEWEASGSPPPPPRMSLQMILAHLTSTLHRDEGGDE